jgi:protein-disulfide isomerase
LIFSLAACRGPDKKKLADVDGTVITAQEVEDALGQPLSKLQQQIYTLQRQKLDELINERLLSEEAKRRGISVATLVEQEVISKILPVTDEEISVLYNANKGRIPVELDQVREQIRNFLRDQRLTAQKGLFIKRLREKAKVVSYLTPPPVFRAELSVVDEPFKGPEKAPVTIVKFEDFQCPFCKQVQSTLVELLKRYDGNVKLVHKDFPLESIHPQASQAAEAARCANEQGKFWSYHDKLYANAQNLSSDDLRNYAKATDVNVESFDRCFTSGKYKAVVQKNLSEATRLGLTGTPAFFINGREISGNQPLEAFAAIVDEELAQAK